MTDVVTPAVRPTKDRLRKLHENALQRPNAASTVPWTVVLPVGHTMEDVLKPHYWSSVARLFDPRFHTFINIVNEEHTLFAQLYVQAVQENQLIVRQIGETQDWSIKSEVIHSLTPKWNVGKRGYDVIRVSDKAVIQDGSKFKTEEQALDWIKAHVQAIAA